MMPPGVREPDGRPLVDVGNPLIGRTPARLDTGSADLPDGPSGVITIRTPSTSMTIFMSADALREWAGVFNGLADNLGAPKLALAGPADIGALNQLLEQERRTGGH